MKHVKLYEQYDFEDLSDEELFGKHNDVIRLLGSPKCHIIEKIDEKGNIILYNGFKWIPEKDAKIYIDCINPTISNDTKFDIYTTDFDENGRKIFDWTTYSFSNLPKKIKDMIS